VVIGRTNTNHVEAAKIAAEAARFAAIVDAFAAILTAAGLVCIALGLGSIATAICSLHRDVHASIEARTIAAAHVEHHVAWVWGHKVRVAVTTTACLVVGVITFAHSGLGNGQHDHMPSVWKVRKRERKVIHIPSRGTP